MLKAATFLAALVLSPFCLFSQQPSASASPDLIRSLEIQVSELHNDTAKLAILAKLGIAFVPVDLAKSRQVADEMQRIAFETKHGEGQARFFFLRMRIAIAGEELSEAIFQAKNLVHVYDSLGFLPQKLSAERKIAAISIRSGKFNDGLEIYFRQLKTLEKEGPIDDLFYVYQNIGIVFHDQKRIADALFYDKKALQVAEKMGSPYLLGQAWSNLAWEYSAMPDSATLAEVTMKKALSIFEKADTCPSCQARLNIFLVDLFTHQKRFDEALQQSEKAVASGRKSNDPTARAEALLARAQALLLADRVGLAQPLIEEAEAALEGGDKNAVQLYLLMTKAQNHFAFGRLREGNALLLEAMEWKDSLAAQTFDIALSEATVKFKTDSIEAQTKILATSNENLTTKNRLSMAVSSFLVLSILGGIWFFLRLKRQKKRIEEQRNELETLNATKDKFFAIIAHDLRGPIVSFHGLIKKINWLIGRGEANRVAELGTAVDDAATGLHRLLDNLLSWALVQRGTMPYHPEAIGLREEAELVVSIFKNALDARHITVKMTVAPSFAVRADRNALSCILRNLTDNAVKYTPDGSEIELRAEQKDEKIALTISDNGGGMAPEQLAQIFEIKKTDKGRSRGTGLGLVLCKELAEQNDGNIEVESTPGRGTSITVFLPAIKKAA